MVRTAPEPPKQPINTQVAQKTTRVPSPLAAGTKNAGRSVAAPTIDALTSAAHEASVLPQAQQASPAPPTAGGVSTAPSVARTGASAPAKRSSDFQQLLTEHAAACASTKASDKTDFLARYNQHYSKSITTEDAAMQFTAVHLAYMHMPKGSTVAFHVQKDVDGIREDSYPQEAILRDTVTDSREQGVKAHVLWPKDEGNTRQNRVVIVFKGTGGSDALSLQSKEASGVTADIDERGIGRAGFRNTEDALLKHVHTAILEGRPVTITGHSLGGACAARLMGMLDPVDQTSAVKLITFGAPHLEDESAAKVVPNNPGVRCYQTKGDPVPLAGGTAIAGRYFQTYSKAWLPSAKHNDISLVRRDLDDPSTDIRKYATEGNSSFIRPKRWVENGRLFASRWNNGASNKAK